MLAKPEKMKIVGDVKKSNDRMRALLVDVCTTAAEALKAAREAEGDGERWRHLGAGVGALRSMLRPKPETLAFFTEVDYYLRHEGHLRWTAEPVSGSGNVFHTPPEAMDFVLSNPPMGDLPPGADGVEAHAEPIDPKAPKMVRGERSMIGIRSTTSAMIAWNFQDIHIVCDAQRIEEGKWRIVGRANGEERISAIVTGGRWAANVYLKFIRNGMTARARRLKGLRMKAAAAAEPQREVS